MLCYASVSMIYFNFCLQHVLEIYGGYINAPLEPSCKTDYKACVKAATEVNGVSLREHS